MFVAGGKKSRVIGVLSGKGGVGKSVTAVNLCALLTKLGKTNILVDGDLSNPSVALHLGLAYTSVGLSDCLNGRQSVADAIVIQPQTGMRILPASLRYRKEASLKHLRRVIGALNGYEFVVIDSPPGLTEDAWHIMSACDDIILITTPDVPSVTSAAKTLALCKECGAKPFGVVLNRVTRARYELTPREIASMVEAPVIAEIPEDYAVPASIAARMPLVLYKSDSPAAKKFYGLARRLAGEQAVITLGGGWLDRILAVFKRLFVR